MEISIKWAIIGIVFFSLGSAETPYHEYSVEESCVNGNATLVLDTAQVGSVGILRATFLSSYEPDRDCTIRILPPKYKGVVLSVQRIDLYQKGLSCQDYLKVYHSDVFSSPTVLCRFKVDMEGKLSFYSKEMMVIVYHAGSRTEESPALKEGFSLIFTVVSEDPNECLEDDRYVCDNGRCIPSATKCDGYNNCGDRSDESTLVCDNGELSMFQAIDVAYVIVITIFIFFSLLTCAVIVSRRRRHVEDTESVSDTDEPTAYLTPYQAMYPTEFSICQNPAGPDTFHPHYPTKIIHMEGGFSNPCYPTGESHHLPQYNQ